MVTTSTWTLHQQRWSKDIFIIYLDLQTCVKTYTRASWHFSNNYILSLHYHRTFIVLSIPEQNYRANVALTLQPYFYRTSNAMYGILGLVVNKKVTLEK